jgi:hypothetical protein
MVGRHVALLAALALAIPAEADANQCHVVDVNFVPADQLQIVGWVEKPDGTYVDTIYITQKTGLFGLANRPGRFDFNSGPVIHDLWPYGRRITMFPVWSHRRFAATNQSWPKVIFQNDDDDNLSHPFDESSPEQTPPYCRPELPTEPSWDTGTCASPSYTDKGMFSPSETVLYPPRADVTRNAATDAPSVDLYKAMNPFDAISQATPDGGACAQITWPIPATLPEGQYVMWFEINKSFDFNATFNPTTLPPPSGIPWMAYGKPYRGQPSIVYSVPFTLSTVESTTATSSYAGFSDVDGSTGTLHLPDPSMITEDTEGSGARRLELIAGSTDRLRVKVRPENDNLPPGAPARLQADSFSGGGVTLSFLAPGDDGFSGKVSGYDIRVRAGEITADNFEASMPVTAQVAPSNPPTDCGTGGGFPLAGTKQTVTIPSLLPETDYWVGVRAFDKCHNLGPIAIATFTTPPVPPGHVDACFVATAAYGSRLANDVEMLRRFRDVMLQSTVLGELAVETYYTFGPAVAGVIGESELLRTLARDFLSPIVARVRRLAY